MPLGFCIGNPESHEDLPFLCGFPCGCKNSMAKPKLKVKDDTRLLVLARAHHLCERCGNRSTGLFFSVHHRAPRQMGGSRDANLHLPANLLVLCGSGVNGCHGWVESNREKARADGYLLFKIENAEEIPFVDNFGNTWIITNDGEKRRFDTIWTVP